MLCGVTGSLPVKLARAIYEDLGKACKSLVLTSDLHLLYLATPPDLGSSEHMQPNWMVYFEKVWFAWGGPLKKIMKCNY